MSAWSAEHPDSWRELLAEDVACVRQGDAERLAVARLPKSREVEQEREALERAAASVYLACAEEELRGARMPSDLSARLRAQADAWTMSAGTNAVVPGRERGFAGGSNGPIARIDGASERAAERSGGADWGVRNRTASRAGWLVAAGVAMVAAAGWWSALSAQREPGVNEAMATLLTRAGDVQKASWTRGTDETGAACAGEVIWSGSQQEGFMVFRGLRPNDPKKEQYQLWIFDPERDERYPVHGGLFDMPPDCGELIVPIRPKLRVPKAAAFVVTVEKPGGVWVSDRSRIATIAKTEIAKTGS